MTSPSKALTSEDIQSLAAWIDLDIPATHLAAVTANLEILRGHSDRIFAFPLTEDREPAFTYLP